MNSNEAIVYCGESMQRLTRGYVQAAVHRVVREPQQTRYSMPLELKPNDFSVLKPLTLNHELTANLATENLFDDMPYHYAKCDSCFENIFGVRHKCKKCPDYVCLLFGKRVDPFFIRICVTSAF
jgi:isopenicillin N synthase-like dioxygenase